MLKILALFLFTTTSFAGTLILEKHAVSGYVMPEHSFVKNCKIFKEGTLEITIKNGDGTATGSSAILHPLRVRAIRALNRLALRGSIEESISPCDIGTVIVKGHHGGKEVEIESSLDCGSKRINKSYAARALRNMAEDICGF